MAKHLEVGRLGEQKAFHFLIAKHYRILETNWRHRRAEIDLIAKDGETLVFVEVKTRSSDTFGTPDAFVTPKKRQLMQAAANVYMEKIGHDWAIRFDIVAVLLHPTRPAEITHFEDAFFE
ncbi:MAG: YraN family protein [Bacteroidota bacterium]